MLQGRVRKDAGHSAMLPGRWQGKRIRMALMPMPSMSSCWQRAVSATGGPMHFGPMIIGPPEDVPCPQPYILRERGNGGLKARRHASPEQRSGLACPPWAQR